MKRFLLLLSILLLPLSALAVTTVPEGVLVVEEEAFANAGLDALIIPASVETVGANVLVGSDASYLYLEGNSTVLAEGAANGVPFVFGPADSAAASLEGFYAAETLVMEDGLYYAVTDTALPLCAQEPFALQGSVTIPKLLNGAPVTSLDALYLSGTQLTELLVPQYLTIPEDLTVTTYPTMSISAPVPDAAEIPAGQYITWSTSAEGAYGDVSYLWTFTVNDETFTTITAEPTAQFAPVTEGSCTAAVTAVDALGDSADSDPSETVTVTAGTAVYRALLVGNTYPGEAAHLDGCDTDVAAMLAVLNSMPGTNYQTTTRLNIDAATIRASIGTAFADAKPGDVSLFYYSGHGSEGGSLVGTGDTYLTVYTLRTALQEIPGTKVVILDCCHSGAVINRSTSSTDSTAAFNSAVISAFASIPRSAENLEDEGYIVLTACRKDQQSSSINAGYIAFGAFTYSLCYGSGYDEWQRQSLGSLPADTDGNGAITLGEAYNGVGPRIDYLNSLLGGSLDQSVQYYGDPAFVLWHK